MSHLLDLLTDPPQISGHGELLPRRTARRTHRTNPKNKDLAPGCDLAPLFPRISPHLFAFLLGPSISPLNGIARAPFLQGLSDCK